MILDKNIFFSVTFPKLYILITSCFYYLFSIKPISILNLYKKVKTLVLFVILRSHIDLYFMQVYTQRIMYWSLSYAGLHCTDHALIFILCGSTLFRSCIDLYLMRVHTLWIMHWSLSYAGLLQESNQYLKNPLFYLMQVYTLQIMNKILSYAGLHSTDHEWNFILCMSTLYRSWINLYLMQVYTLQIINTILSYAGLHYTDHE